MSKKYFLSLTRSLLPLANQTKHSEIFDISRKYYKWLDRLLRAYTCLNVLDALKKTIVNFAVFQKTLRVIFRTKKKHFEFTALWTTFQFNFFEFLNKQSTNTLTINNHLTITITTTTTVYHLLICRHLRRLVVVSIATDHNNHYTLLILQPTV